MRKTAGSFMFFLCLMIPPGNSVSAGEAGNMDLEPCPDSPNCVSTQAADEKHRMEPIAYNGTLDQARQRLLAVIASMKRARIVEDRGDYIHAVFTSLIFRFKDDVEFVFDDQSKLIHFRSASRVGYSDLGVNRKRMDEIRIRFMQQINPGDASS
jgi:uncharacterized protein (DUF1499 family)